MKPGHLQNGSIPSRAKKKNPGTLVMCDLPFILLRVDQKSLHARARNIIIATRARKTEGPSLDYKSEGHVDSLTRSNAMTSFV